MARRRKIRGRETQLAFEALAIEGGVLSADWLARVAQQGAGAQSDAEYRVPKGIQLRDDIGRYWRIAQAYWADLEKGRAAAGDPSALAEAFVHGLLRECLGFVTLEKIAPIVIHDRTYPVGAMALRGRVPVVVAPVGAGLDAPSSAFGDGTRKRSAFGLAQEFLNASDDAMWGIASDALTLRILRDNASLTRPAWIEADVGRMFAEERFADFAALWLLAHETRFGARDRPASECALEAWRNAGREEGTRAREKLRSGVEDALLSLGDGFLAHNENGAIRAALESGALTKEALFQELLRLVYRIIFLLTAEERAVLHDPAAPAGARKLYAQGYGMRRLRDRSARRNAYDRFGDLWEAFKIVLRGLSRGEPRLGLPALGGLFDAGQCPTLDAAKVENRALLFAVFRLSWLREDGSLARVNWRDMGPEELGSVYESLLELVPQLTEGGRKLSFATGAETKGNARKTSGSYYTPDSLVQVLLDSALEPVVETTIAAHPDKPVDALLELSIVDPACGSGHFLLSAARRLAAHVARLEASGTPSAEQYRHALRRVVGRCLFGVDLNAMAVELCKVSLWMEAVEPGRPLSFLDAHIQQGNALLGTTPELMAKAIPDAAWDPIEGDDKKIASALKKQNKQETKELELDFSRTPASTYARLGVGARAVDDEDDATLMSLEVKARHWKDLVASRAFEHQSFVADTWCAAFVWRKETGPLRDTAPTNGVFKALQADGARASRVLCEEVERLRAQYAWFHWPLRFPQVFAKGGFDVIVSNPPWDRVTVEEKEWFAASRPDIVAAATAAKRRALIAELEQLAPDLFERFRSERRRVDGEKSFISSAGRAPLSAQGILNTYPVFVETTLSLVSERGRIGIIVPTGIATAKGIGDLFRNILDSGRLRALRDLHNRHGIFPAVQRNMRFCLLTLSGKRGLDFIVTAQAANLAELHDPQRRCALTLDDVGRVNPETHHLPLFATRRDADIIRGIYLRNTTIGQAFDASVRGRVEFLRMLNTADDSAAFQPFDPEEFREAEAGDWLPLVRDGRAYRPMYEAKLVDQCNHRAATFVGTDRAKRYGLHAAAVESTDAQLQLPDYVSVPRYWVPEDLLPLDIHRPFLLVYRDAVSAVADARCLSAAFVPWGGVGDTLKLAFCRGGADDLVIMASALNSFVLDYVFRQKSSSSHASAFILRQLPFPSLTVFEGQCPWHNDLTTVSWLTARQLELNFTARDLAPFAQALRHTGGPFRWDCERRAVLRAEVDAGLFRLYGVSREDASHILETFPIVARREAETYGDYRTKRVVLEIYDAMADAARAGHPYATLLDPPPADPRLTHPPRARSGSSS